MFNSALYYPTIDIYNDGWLKSAVLFWDRIETIVPESEVNPYHRRSTKKLQDEGILYAHRINPFCNDVRGLEQDVLKYIDTPEGKKSFIKPLPKFAASTSYSLKTREYFHDNFQIQKVYQEQKWRDTYRDFYIHVEKLPMILRERLMLEEGEDGYVWASKGFMSYYMTLLANRICQNSNMALLTDKVSSNNLSCKILTDGLTPIANKREEQKVKRALMYKVVMDDIKIDPHTSMDSIISFRRDRQPELDSFRKEMDKLTTFNTEGMNLKDLKHEIESIYMRQVIPAMDAVKVTLKDARINWITSIGTCILTGVMPSVLVLGTDVNTNIAIGLFEGAGLVVSAVPYLMKRNECNSSPYSYLIKMNKALSPVWRRC